MQERLRWTETLWLWVVAVVLWTFLTVVLLDWAYKSGPHLVDAALTDGVATSIRPAWS